MDTLACLELSLCALMTNIRQIVIIESAAGCLYTHLNTRLSVQLSIYGCFFAVFSLLDHRIKCTIVALNLLLHKSFTLMIVEGKNVKRLKWILLQFSTQHLFQFSYRWNICCSSHASKFPTFSWSLTKLCLVSSAFFPWRGSSVKSQSFSVNRAVC